ncbi:NUDIX domain-containing protein [Streptomyces yangpuensis]|uniref:NUDIX domain-containing protein n=1 Tax=Streptomyces yangpuensis TaxID=1648182 RepID=UPI00381F008B
MSETETETVRYTANTVAVTPSRHIRLIQRGWAPFQGTWALPGDVGAGEAPLVAAARERAEKTGVHVPAGGLHQVGV